MRLLIAFSFLVFSSGAFAFDGAATADQYNDARMGCRQGEMPDGTQLSAADADKQCELLDKLGKDLKAHGWCWDKSEVGWQPCKQSNS